MVPDSFCPSPGTSGCGLAAARGQVIPTASVGVSRTCPAAILCPLWWQPSNHSSKGWWEVCACGKRGRKGWLYAERTCWVLCSWLHKELLLTPDIASTPQLGQLQAQLARLFERSKRKGERDVNHRAAVSRPLNKDGVFELKMEFAVSIGSLIHGPGAAPTAPHFPEIGTWGSCGRRTELSAGRGAGGSEGCSLSAPLPTPQPRQESGGSIPDFKLSAMRLLQQESGRELPAECQFQGKLLCATTFCKRAELQRILPRL